MPISINPVFPVIAAQAAAPEVTLQPGTVIDAEVLKILANDLVRITIANLSIEVLSEIPLQVGQTLRLAVSTRNARLAAPRSPYPTMNDSFTSFAAWRIHPLASKTTLLRHRL